MGLLNTPEMKPTPRNKLLGLLADALTTGRDFADRAKVPDVVPLLGGQGLGSLLLGKAPEELTDISYGNMPVRINPLAGRTASFVPEIKPGRKEQVADLAMALQAVPGGNRAALGALGAVDTGANKAAIVWHGSPHKFDRFDASKIGTGEGAQAYGHGLYLAESPDVADTYRAMQSPMPRLYRDGVPFEAKSYAEMLAESRALGAGSLDEAISRQARRLQTSAPDGRRVAALEEVGRGLEEERRILDALRTLMAEGYQPGAGGNLYKVDLPDEKIARMLDWDKPLSQQAPEVQAALNKLPADVKAHIGIGKYDDLKGGIDIVKPLGGLVGDAKVPGMLRQAGIPGIRYLDGGSRGTGQGTSNFVVFPGEESALRILERNGGLLAP